MLYDVLSSDPKAILAAFQQHKLIRVANHCVKNNQNLIQFAERLGCLLKWDFGYINELKLDPAKNNYLYSNQKVPFHWDGAFHQSPYLMIFHCIKAPERQAGGETLFTDAIQLLNAMPIDLRRLLDKTTLTYQTNKQVHYGGEISLSPIGLHPILNLPTLRFAEPVDTDLNPVSLSISGIDNNQAQSLLSTLQTMLYQKAYCYQHTWQDNELIIADNHALLHGRNAFNYNSQRHIKRVQVLSPNNF